MARLKEYTAEEIVLATDNFSWRLRSESVGIWGTVYKGYVDDAAISIKFLTSPEERVFNYMVKSLGLIRHPHLLSMLGFCSELKCFVYEHIEYSRVLHEVVKQNLHWHDRIRIANDICSALSYIIKRARCEPIVPDYLNASNILVDRHLNAKINVVLKRCDKPDLAWDVKTFGYLVLNLLNGIPGNCFSYCYVRWFVGLPQGLDKTAGQWPMDLAEKLMNVCRRCVDCNPRDDFRKKYIMVIIVKKMNDIREKADEMVRGRAGTYDLVTSGRDQDSDIPTQFYCPIYKEVMMDPHVAADGFSYEREGIEKWLQTGHDTSPMTNLKLNSKILTPNRTLKILIEDWYRER
ncbi:putative aminoacyltransferase, E1 ubiquitin-activating enzyme [Rosa chinensis]|uniref:RING-type E3 ubiquitin transferase n=1 Tax=Rosa chinensis TaxID=74649 RepID=A0A2P6RPV2_ROSCH|nr:putative U-box domain-containing protein 50 isoform X3 [Rosa chinensis]PRQ48468.1 putative aminoacyltransferase, E1 ubiquitin-activating enzyme [Rosa chinensis]